MTRRVATLFGITGALLFTAGLTAPRAQADDAALKLKVDALSAKVDKLQTELSSNPLSGLAISGYIDPTYVANGDRHTSSFFFADKTPAYTYYHSTFGDAFLEFKQTFADKSTLDLQIMPDRGYGVGAGSIVNAAVLTVPVNGATSFIAGQVPAWDGYEGQTSPGMLTITHNLLYDFSEPGYFTGAGGSYTSGAFTAQALVANTWNTSYNTAFRSPTLEYRLSMAPSSSLSFGLFGTVGKAPTVTGAPGAGTTRVYNDFDGAYTAGAVTVDWQFDYGQQRDGAANGGNALWYGTSLLGNYRFDPLFGATLRYDYLNDQKNGGHIATGDSADGFMTDPANSAKGPIRQAITAALLLYPTKETIFKVEYRHDFANFASFLNTTNGTYSKSNNTVAAQVVYSF